MKFEEPIELITPTAPFQSTADTRPRMPEPLPVKLVTIDHAHLPAAAGREVALDEFYVNLLGFERIITPETLAYHAENFDLFFDILEPPLERDTLRALGIEVLSLADAQRKLIESQIEHIRQQGLLPGHDSILLQDPAGNWLALTESRLI
ncbi:MAG: hypothetical protein JWN40_4022 [Phycisphaerales bacterium]|nr:hypothetical protein [Phycisphaerales bacterium]